MYNLVNLTVTVYDKNKYINIARVHNDSQAYKNIENVLSGILFKGDQGTKYIKPPNLHELFDQFQGTVPRNHNIIIYYLSLGYTL